MTVKRTVSEVAFEHAKEELTDYAIYTELSKSERKENISFKRILDRAKPTRNMNITRSGARIIQRNRLLIL